MTRDEMLEKLRNIKPGVELTVLPTEEAIECEYISDEGHGYEWIGMWDWPAYRLSLPSTETLELIINKITSKSLTLDDIANTELESLYNSQEDETDIEINNFYEKLKSLSLVPNGEIYGLRVSKGFFFSILTRILKTPSSCTIYVVWIRGKTAQQKSLKIG